VLNGEATFHIKLVAPVGVDVFPDQGSQGAQVFSYQAFRPVRTVENALQHQGVDVDHAVLEEMEAEHTGFVIFGSIACEFAALGEEDKVVGTVPSLDDVEAFMNFTA
jgi:hypothetical protein